MATRHKILFDAILLSWLIETALVAAQTNELRCQCSCTSMKNPDVIMYASGNLHQKGNMGLMDSLNVKEDAATNTKKKTTERIKTGRQVNPASGSQSKAVYDTSAYAVNENNSVTLNLQMINSNKKQQNNPALDRKLAGKTKPSTKSKKGLTLRTLNELLKAATSQLLSVFSKQSSASKTNKGTSNKNVSKTNMAASNKHVSKTNMAASNKHVSKTNMAASNKQSSIMDISVKNNKQFQPVTDAVIAGLESIGSAKSLSAISQSSQGGSNNLQKTKSTSQPELDSQKDKNQTRNSLINKADANSIVKGLQEVTVNTFTPINDNTMAGSARGSATLTTSKPEIYIHQDMVASDSDFNSLSVNQAQVKNQNFVDEFYLKQRNKAQVVPGVSVNPTKKDRRADMYIPPEPRSPLDNILQTRTPIDFGSFSQQSDQIAGGSLASQKQSTQNVMSPKASTYIPSYADVYNPLDRTGGILDIRASNIPSAKINLGSSSLQTDLTKANSKTSSVISNSMEIGSSQYKTELNTKPDGYIPPGGEKTPGNVATNKVKPDVYTPPSGLNIAGAATVDKVTKGSGLGDNIFSTLLGANTGQMGSSNTIQNGITDPPPHDFYKPPKNNVASPTGQTLNIVDIGAAGMTLGGNLPGANTGQMDSSNTISNGITDSPPHDVYKPPKNNVASPTDQTLNIVDIGAAGMTLGVNTQVASSSTNLSGQGSGTGTQTDIYVPPVGSQTDVINSNSMLQNQVQNSLMDAASQYINNPTKKDQSIPSWITATTQSPILIDKSLNDGSKKPPNWIMDTTPSPVDTWNQLKDKTLPPWITDTTPVPRPENTIQPGGRDAPSWFIDTTPDPRPENTINTGGREPPAWIMGTTQVPKPENTINTGGAWIMGTTPASKPENTINTGGREPPAWIMGTTPASKPENTINTGGREPPAWVTGTTPAPKPPENTIKTIGSSWIESGGGGKSSLMDSLLNQNKNPPSWFIDAGNPQQSKVNPQQWISDLPQKPMSQQDIQNTLQTDIPQAMDVKTNPTAPSWLTDSSASLQTGSSQGSLVPNSNAAQTQPKQTPGNPDISGAAKLQNSVADDWAMILNQDMTGNANIPQSSASTSISQGNQLNNTNQAKVTFENVDWNNLIMQLKNEGQNAVNSNIQNADQSIPRNDQQRPIVSGQPASKSSTSNDVNMQELTTLFENYVKNVRGNRAQKRQTTTTTPSTNQYNQNEQLAIAMMLGHMIN